MSSNYHNPTWTFPDSVPGLEPRATADDRVYSLDRPATSNKAPRRCHLSVRPREHPEVYVPSGLGDVIGGSIGSSTSNHRSQAQLNPFEDPQYEYGTSISTTQPFLVRPGGLDNIPSDPSATTTGVKEKGCLKRLRDRIRAMFIRSPKATLERERSDATRTLPRGEGTHLGRGTMRGMERNG